MVQYKLVLNYKISNSLSNFIYRPTRINLNSNRSNACKNIIIVILRRRIKNSYSSTLHVILSIRIFESEGMKMSSSGQQVKYRVQFFSFTDKSVKIKLSLAAGLLYVAPVFIFPFSDYLPPSLLIFLFQNLQLNARRWILSNGSDLHFYESINLLLIIFVSDYIIYI